MVSKLLIGISLLLSLLMVACSEDESNPVTEPRDTVAPAAITDLAASNPTGNSVVLCWTVPGDDNMVGKAAEYDIRYSTALITESNFESATRFDDAAVPTVADMPQCDTVTGLSPTTKYYFAIKTADETSNWSGISNVDSVTTHLAGIWTVYTQDNSGLPADNVRDIAIQSISSVWVTTAAGLVNIAGDTWTIFDTENSDIISNDLSAVAVDGAGVKWIGSRSEGFSRFNGVTFENYDEISTGVMINVIRDIAAGSDEEIWFGTGNAGLFKFQSSAWTSFNTSNSDIGSNIIGPLAFDSFGDLWIGYNPGGAGRFNGTDFENFNAGDGFTSAGVSSIATQGTLLWFGTESGAFVYDGSDWQGFNTSNSGIASNVVLSVAVDLSGDKWFGTVNGLSRYSGSTWTNYSTENSSLPDNMIQVIKVDPIGNIWVGTAGGLAVFND